MLGDNETVTQFIHRTRNLVAYIQIISELLEEKWQLLYPNNVQYTGHLGVDRRDY